MFDSTVQVSDLMICSLASGSSGNCIYVESGDTAVLLDAGISGSRTAERLAAIGRAEKEIAAVLLSHDHSDHTHAAGILSRRFKSPVYATAGTLSVRGDRLGRCEGQETFAPGDTLEFGDILIETHPTPHDAVEGVAFVVQCAGLRFGVLTDLGHVFPELIELISGLDGMLIESNYDPEMLASGIYPPDLKDRIRGPNGHLSNQEAAGLVASCSGEQLQCVLLGHLSQNNNTPRAALDCFTSRVREDERFREIPVHVAPRHTHGPAVILTNRGLQVVTVA